MADAERPVCRTCQSGDIDPRSDKGFCRFNPPVVVMGHTKIQAVFPHVSGTDWCSAHSRTLMTVREVDPADGERF